MQSLQPRKTPNSPVQAHIVKLRNPLLLLGVPIRAVRARASCPIHKPLHLARHVRQRRADRREAQLFRGARARRGGLFDVRVVRIVERAEVGDEGQGAVDDGLRGSARVGARE
jgi:hypothetical protein